MIRKNKGILLLAVLLLILLILYFGLRTWNQNKEKEKKQLSEISVTDTDPDQITDISLNVGNGEMEFVKENGTWYYAQDKDFPLQQSYPEKMADALADITADRELKDGDAPEDYGLTEPQYTAGYTDKDGNVTKILFGNMTGEDYYLSVDGSDSVYTVGSEILDSLNYQLEDMAQLDDYPSIGSGNLKKVVITQNGTQTVYDSSDSDQDEDIATIAGGLGAVTLSKAADYSVADEDLTKYGLDDSSRITVAVTYTDNDKEKQLTIYIGNKNENNQRYVMLNDSRIVYLISDEICCNILDSKSED